MRVRNIVWLLLLSTVLTGCVVVEDGTIGVSKSFGKISDDALTPDWYVHVPLFREVEVWDVKTQRRTLTIDTPSKEGLIVRAEATLLFRPLDVIGLRKTIGQNYVITVVDTSLRDIFRETIGKENVEAVYKNPERLAKAAKDTLEIPLKERGIVIEQLLVTDLVLPSTYKEAIERKLDSEQRALQKEFDLQQATKDAEIDVVKARGQAEAQKIQNETLSPLYLQWLWISTLKDNQNVIYVATEANMPIVRTNQTGGGQAK